MDTQRSARWPLLFLAVSGWAAALDAPPAAEPGAPFAFAYMADLHTWIDGEPEEALRAGAARLLADGPGAFLVTGGDYDNYPETERYLDAFLLEPLRARGVAYPWFTVVGNHDTAGTPNNPERNGEAAKGNIAAIARRNALQPWIVNRGPASRSALSDYRPDLARHTTFSFDYGDMHGIVADVYSAIGPDQNRTLGVIDDALVDWIAADLAATERRHVFVFIHEPARVYDGLQAWNGERRPTNPADCARGARERLWTLLKNDPRVVAWVCGHNHSFGLVRDGTLWQVAAAQEWTGLRMFIRFLVEGEAVTARVYAWDGEQYHHRDHPLRPLPPAEPPRETTRDLETP